MEDFKRTLGILMVNFIMFQTVMLSGKQGCRLVLHEIYNAHSQNKEQNQLGYYQMNDSFPKQSLDSLGSPWKFSGYFDFYWANDGKGVLQNRDYGNLVSYSRLGEIQLNLAMIKLTYQKADFRSNLALGVGTYMMKNLSNEPLGLRNIYEANFGLKLHQKRSIWMDVGVFPSHIGFESAIGYECLNLTRSLLAENSPYYESGCRLVGGKNSLTWGLYLLNGWQTMYKTTLANKGLDFGAQLNKKWNKMEFNYSNIIVRTSQGSMGYRYFHNFYWKWESAKHWNLIAGIDIGIQKNLLQEKQIWQTPILIVAKQWGKHRFAIRTEKYKDLNGVVIKNSFNQSTGINISGGSVNYDFQMKENVWMRLEYRKMRNQSAYFQTDANADPSKTISMVTLALQAKF